MNRYQFFSFLKLLALKTNFWCSRSLLSCRLKFNILGKKKTHPLCSSIVNKTNHIRYIKRYIFSDSFFFTHKTDKKLQFKQIPKPPILYINYKNINLSVRTRLGSVLWASKRHLQTHPFQTQNQNNAAYKFFNSNLFFLLLLTLQSQANLRASMMAAFLSLSDSKATTKDTPFFACQYTAWAAAFPPPLTPHSYYMTQQPLKGKMMMTTLKTKRASH